MASQLEEETTYTQYIEQYQANESNVESFTNQKDAFGKEREEIDKELDSLVGGDDRQAYDDKKQERDTASANYDKADKDLTAAEGEFSQFKQDNPEHTAQYEAEQKESQLKDLEQSEIKNVGQTLGEHTGQIEDANKSTLQTPEGGYNSQTPDADSKQSVAFGDKEQNYLNQSGIEGQGNNYQTQSADNSLDAQSKKQAAATVGITTEQQEQGEDMLAEFGNDEPEQQEVGDRLAPANDNKDILAEYGGDESPEQESSKENQDIQYQNATESLMEAYENEEPMQAANDNEKEQER